jgi:hypothetical protein
MMFGIGIEVVAWPGYYNFFSAPQVITLEINRL